VTTALLNPAAGNGGGPLVSVSAVRKGGAHSNDVAVTVTVSKSTTVTARDSQSGHSTTISCSGTCSGEITSVGSNAGTVTFTAEGDSKTDTYVVRP
jgi:hypothetical protein